MISLRLTAILCAALLIAQNPYAFAQQPQSGGRSQTQSKSYSSEQLDSLVAPVALYPDPILSQLLVASTYPLEVVEAGRGSSNTRISRGKLWPTPSDSRNGTRASRH